MKKIGLIVLAVILALGALGAAYAAWNSTINVSAAVQMGTVVIGILDQGSQGSPSYSGFDPVGGGYYNGVNESFTNAYPGCTINYHFWLGNIGTLPVKFSTELTGVDGYSWAYLTDASWSGTIDGVAITDASQINGVLDGLAATGQGGHVDVNLTITLNNDLDQATYQGQTGVFQVTVTGTESH